MAIKVYAMNDCDWMAGDSLQSCKDEYRKHWAGDCREDIQTGEYECFDDPHEVSDEAMDRLRFRGDDDEGGTRTFREQLNKMINDGVKFPTFFASTEF